MTFAVGSPMYPCECGGEDNDITQESYLKSAICEGSEQNYWIDTSACTSKKVKKE